MRLYFLFVVASIPSPPGNGVHLGPLDLHFYGLMYIAAVVAAIAITIRRWEAAGGSRRLVYEVAAWGFPAGLVGGRVYFDITSSNLVPDHWWGPFAIWDGGLGIWGGIAAGTVAGLVVLRRRRADIPRFLDAAAPALLVAQAIGRVGNYFNQELFGGPTNLPWGLEISPAHRPPGYVAFSTFQPTFLYELIWNLGLAGFLVWLGHHRRIRAPGLFALYVTGYSGFRIFEELLRVDPAHHLLGFRLNFWVACALTLAGAAWFVAIQRRQGTAARSHRARRWALFALGWATLAAVGCGASHERSIQTSRADRWPERHVGWAIGVATGGVASEARPRPPRPSPSGPPRFAGWVAHSSSPSVSGEGRPPVGRSQSLPS